MNDAAFGKLERLLQGWHIYWLHDADYEDCDICRDGRAELGNALNLLAAAELIVHCNKTDALSTDWYMAWRQVEAAIRACRAEMGKNQNA